MRKRKAFTPLEIRGMRMQNKFLTGFTLIELMVVIVIIGFVIGLLLPALRAARKKMQSVTCASNLRQLGLAANNYCADFDGYFPSTLRTFGIPLPGGLGSDTPGGAYGYTIPWPEYFVRAGYVDSRELYYCPMSTIKLDLQTGNPRYLDPSYTPVIENDDVRNWMNGGSYGMNEGLQPSWGGVAAGFDMGNLPATPKSMPARLHTIIDAPEKILFADKLDSLMTTRDGGLNYEAANLAPEFPATPDCAVFPGTMAGGFQAPWRVFGGSDGEQDERDRISFRHPGERCQVVFCDGHVGSLKPNDDYLLEEAGDADHKLDDGCQWFTGHWGGPGSADRRHGRWAPFAPFRPPAN